MFRCGRRPDATLQQSARAAFEVLQNGVRDLFAVPRGAPLDAAQTAAMLSAWSQTHGFAHLALAGQFDALAGDGGRTAFVHTVLAPMLQQQIEGLLAVAPPARHRPR